jgi:hypothetical protein
MAMQDARTVLRIMGGYQRTTKKWRLLGQKSPKFGGHIYHVDSSGTLTIFTPTPCSKFRRNATNKFQSFAEFFPFYILPSRITAKPFPSSRPPFELFCYIFYTTVFCKKNVKVSGDDVFSIHSFQAALPYFL